MSESETIERVTTLAPLAKLARDVKQAAAGLSIPEVRYLVGLYYQLQDDRIRDANQVRQLIATETPSEVLQFFAGQHAMIERQCASVLDSYSGSKPIGVWMRSIVGIGPIISAGMMAHIDIEKAATAGQIWRFAGLDPTTTWGKGEKRPWNAQLKVLCWKLGESFVKTCNHERSFYGPIYAERKRYEEERDARGDNAKRAAEILTEKSWKGDTTSKARLLSGHLPQAQLHARAKRFAVKLFLSHLHQTWRKMEGLPVGDPYPMAHMGHAHKIEPPA